MRYQDFVLTFSQLEGDDLQVQAVSPSGRRTETCSLPIESLDHTFWRSADEDSACPGSPESAQQTGETLYRALFSGEIGQLLSQGLGRAGDEGGLRLVLSFDPETEESLIRVPWETLFRHESNSFLALSVRTPILRQIQTPEHREPSRSLEKLHILMVVSEGGGVALQLDLEREAIERAFEGDPRVTFDLVKPASTHELREALQRRETHVLHYMGHGHVTRYGQEGRLFLGDSQVTGPQLAQQLQDFRSLRLIFLNACHSARNSQSMRVDPFAGVAPALLRKGFPAVLAMSRAISDPAAIEFSEKFYRRLGAGDYMATAVSEGRLAICEINRHAVEWATPVLFANHSDARLLSGPPPSPPRPWWVTTFFPPYLYLVVVVGALTLLFGTSAMMLSGSKESSTMPNETTPTFDHSERESSLILSEVLYNLPDDDDGREFVELYNAGTETLDLAGFSLGFGGLDYSKNTVQLQGKLGPGEPFVIGGPISDQSNGWPVYQQEHNFEPDIQNSGSTHADGVALFNTPAINIRATSLPLDQVRYGPSNTNRLPGKAGDDEKIEVDRASPGHSIERRTLDGEWRITGKPDPNRVRFEDLD